jgi:alpha-maltose-1-phosphate synthase
MNTANAAIHFIPEGYSTSGTKLMGRQSAGEGFLKAFVKHGNVPTLYCHAPDQRAANEFARFSEAHADRRTPVRWVRYSELPLLGEPGTLYLPGPGLERMAWRRRRVGATAYSLCGVTHTIASQTGMDGIAHLVSAPVMPWDAVVCTSRAVQQSVERLLATEAEYLAERFGAQRTPLPHLALIPLGADCDAYAPNPDARIAWRARHAIGEDDVAFLFLGRLSFHAKANPLPMYVALERAAKRARRRLHLIQAGWFGNADIERAFREGALAWCPSVNAIFLDGRDPAVRANVWQAADVFISLSDNVQETFGLTPVEAMAAGLPSIVSDWDGYRDTVRDGVDGFCIPTLMPGASAASDLARRHEDEPNFYDLYVGFVSLAISVDIPACADACTALANDPALRRRLGNAARERARSEFDWRVIIRRYQALWQELASIRGAAPVSPIPPVPNPRRADPFWLFAEYPTRILADGDRLAVTSDASRSRLAALRNTPLIRYGNAAIASEEDCMGLIDRLAEAGNLTMRELLQDAKPENTPALVRTLVWLHKLDLVRLIDDGGTTTGTLPHS